MLYGETITISNSHCITILEGLLNGQVFELVGDVRIGTTVGIPLIIKILICLSHHSS